MAKSTQTPQEGKHGRIVAIIAMFFLFAMISFVTNLAAPLGKIWENSYSWAGMMGNLMNFLPYLIMGIPAGKLLMKIGYKKTALWAMSIGFIGIAIQYLSSLVGAETACFTVEGKPVMLNFIIYLLGALTSGFCVCMLNTVVNPMLNLLGGGGKEGNRLLQLGGSFNSLSATLTPLFVGVLMGAQAKTLLAVSPLLLIAMGVFLLSFLVILFVKIPEPISSSQKKVKYTHSAWNFRHTVMGVIGIFFYVGIEVGIPGVLFFYLTNTGVLGVDSKSATAVAGAVVAVYWLLMLVGRLSSSMISSKVSSRAQLIFVSATAIFLVMLAIFLPSSIRVSMPAYSVEDGFSMAEVPISALMLVLCGLCTSVMWGGIFNLAVEGLGKYTSQASGMFMMMVVGGGVMPLIQNALAKSSFGYLNSYWLVVAMLAYLFYYALIGSRNVNKDIPTSLEDEKDVSLNL